jgi:hypothetical protein
MAITNHDCVGTRSERKKGAAEATARNALVQSWPADRRRPRTVGRRV